jgi:hypothetical protein
LFGCAIRARRLKRRPFQGQVTSVVSHSRVFSCAMIVRPALPASSFEPVCSACQCVLKIPHERAGRTGRRAVDQDDTARAAGAA